MQEPSSSAAAAEHTASADVAAASTTSTTPPTRAARSRLRRWLRGLCWLLAGFLFLLCSLIGLAWWWAGNDDSLSRTLARVASWMPADQQLEADGIHGSLRHGGRIEWLRWTSPNLQIEIKGADIQWRLQPLLQRELRLGKVDMDELRIRSTPQPDQDSSSPTPLESLTLPMRIDVPVRIAQLVWEGPPAHTIRELHGHYRYDGAAHQLQISSLRYADGHYTADAKLQAHAPMALQAQVSGHVLAPLPGPDQQTLPLSAKLQITGHLATENAELRVQGQAQPDAPNDAQTPGSARLQASVDATLRPWQAQPVAKAQAQLQELDLALFWQGGPHTRLQGAVAAGPQGDGWALQADVHNLIPGPWDQQGLPVRELQAQVQFDGAHTWHVEQAQVSVGPQGKAQLQVQGTWDTSTQALNGQAQLQQLQPSDLWSTVDAAPLSGQLRASGTAADAVQWQVDLQSASARSSAPVLLEMARGQGSWRDGVLQIQQLDLHALRAQLQTRQLRIDTQRQQVQGPVQVKMPGAQLDLQADAQLTQGKGDLQWQLRDAAQWSQWLTQLPTLENALGGAQLSGQAQARLQWQGGWQGLMDRLANRSPAQRATGLQLQLSAQAPQLQWQAAGSAPVTLNQLNAQLQGSPENLAITLQSQLHTGVQQLQVQSRLTAGLATTSGSAALDWQAQVQQLQLHWQPQQQYPATWQAQLQQAITIRHSGTGNASTAQRIQVTAGQLQLQAPQGNTPTSAAVQWDALQAQRTGSQGWTVQSKGHLPALPLAWLNALDPRKPMLTQMGVGGDLILRGHWDIDTQSRQPRVQVLLERESGDVRLAVADPEAMGVTTIRSSGTEDAVDTLNRRPAAGRGLPAGLETLRIAIDGQGQGVQAQVRWDSKRAGNLQADVRSQWRLGPDGLQWPDNAPLNGSVRASLPNLGIWALFAPPGWRAGGTLQANVAIAGTRQQPQWNGTIDAEQLHIQSVLDGVDLKDGRLNARLQGTRLEITQLFLRGGQGSSARILGSSGNLTSAPEDGGTLQGQGVIEWNPQAPAGQSGIHMDISAQAQQLQVLVRADRQLSVSGTLHAGMHEGHVALTGDLRVDRAAILLADESAPKLDDDVFVTTAATRAAAAAEVQNPSAAGQVSAAQSTTLDVKLDLGNDFALQGYGITTRLRGQLQLAAGPRLTGTIETVNGRYRAWGQSLDVQSGTIRFSGDYANPALDIVAVRPNIEVTAGVKVTGSATQPRVSLFSEPEMPDAEKLSWVIMGRDTSAGGAETALLQQAALALLSGGGNGENFAGRVGLDEIGFKGPSDDGETGASFTLGKRLSQDFYVSYEQSLNGAMGTLYIFYELSRRLTLRGQTGEQTAIDLIYTRSKD